MVINTKYRFTFVHIPKSAGNSLMSFLSGLEGNKENWLAKTKHETLAEFERRHWKRKSPVDWLLARSPSNYYNFCFVRNPWDRMASFYRYLSEKKPRHEIKGVRDFHHFLRLVDDGEPWIQSLHTMRSQLDYFTGCGEAFEMTFVGHMEHLEEDLASVSGRIGREIKLGRLNSSSNSSADYRLQYDDDMIDIVARRFKDEISYFGYGFENPAPTKRLSDKPVC